MKEILTRLQEFEYIKMVVFAEEVILRVRFLSPKRFLYNRSPLNDNKMNVWIGPGWNLANLWLFGVISFERFPAGKGNSICTTTKALCDKQSTYAVWYTGGNSNRI